MKSIPLTGSFQTILGVSSGNAQVQCFSARTVFDKISSEIGSDYYSFVHLFLESFDIASRITSLVQAPLPDVNDLDSRTEQATKIYNNWLNYEKVAIQILYDDGGGIFRNQGQPVIIQNLPFQLPIKHLRPYLSASQDVILVGKDDRIGAQVLSGTDYKQLSGADEVLIKGQWRAEVELVEIKSQSIANWLPIGVDLPPNQPVIISPSNPRRRALYIVNAGLTNVRFFYGDIAQLTSGNCPYLTPNGTFNQETWGNYAITQQLIALSVGGAGRIVGMEGSI